MTRRVMKRIDMGNMRRKTACVIAVFALCAMMMAGAAGAPSSPATDEQEDPEPMGFVPFSPNIRVNSVYFGYSNQMEPSMVLDSSGRIYVAWWEQDPLVRGTRVAYAYSDDGGLTWPTSGLISQAGSRYQEDVWLAISQDDRLFASDCVYDLNHDLLGIGLRNTTDGANWGTPSFHPEFANRPTKAVTAVDAAGGVNIIYTRWDLITGYYDIVFVRTDDGGASWTPEAYVADVLNYATNANILVHPNGTLLASWFYYGSRDILFDRSFDRGLTWGTDVRVNDVQGAVIWPSPSRTPIPAMAVAPNGEIYAVWPDSRSGESAIYFARSFDGGQTWMRSVRVSENVTGAGQYLPDIAVDPFGVIHVAWVDTRNGTSNIYYANSTDFGASFGPNLRVTTNSTPLTYPTLGDHIALESDSQGNIYIVWTDGRDGDLDIYFARLDHAQSMTIDTIPSGLTVEVDGVPYTAPHTVYCTIGSGFSINAPSPQSLGPTQYAFISWSDLGEQSHVIACDPSGVYIATFSMAHEVIIDTMPPNLDLLVDGATLSAPQTFWWGEGSSHDLDVPSPQGGASTRYAFNSWSDDTAKAHTITVTDPGTFTATFDTWHRLALQSARGSPACSNADCWFDEGAMAGFSVAGMVQTGSDTRHIFQAWTGDSAATENSSTIIMDGPKTITATWITQYLLTIHSDYGTPQGAGWYAEGSIAAISIEDRVTVNGTEFVFIGWTGDSEAMANSTAITMDGPKALTAAWQRAQTDTVTDFPLWLLIIIMVLVFLLIVLVLWRRKGRQANPSEMKPGDQT